MGATSAKSFISQFKTLGSFADNVSNGDVKNEPMFYNCDFNFAMEHGGEITKSFLSNLPDDWKNQPLVFDSRVHMLMPGWYPAIPGWHHDDVPRDGQPGGQPDYDNPSYQSEHILGLVNADVCPTLFATGECTMTAVPQGEVIYAQWHEEVVNLTKSGDLKIEACQDRTLYFFNCDTFHTGQKALLNGFRWFGRVSRNTDRIENITNEIRVNAQVYLEFPMQGW